MIRIKIAYCVVALDGGVGNLILNYCDYLPKDEYEIYLITQDDSSENYKKAYLERGIRILTVPPKKESLIGNVIGLNRIMKKYKFDIVHAHMAITNVFPLTIAMFCGVKTRISHSHLDSKHNVMTRLLTFGGNTVATDYFACGQDAGSFLFGSKKFTILNNAIPLREYEFKENIRKEERKKMGISDDALVIGHVGRFTNQKNHHMILDIFKNVLQMEDNAMLLLIGDGELYDVIQTRAEQLGIRQHIILTGAISDVKSKLQVMDVFLLPSLFEGLPVSIIEAQAAGLGCLLSKNVSSFSKINENVRFLDLQEPLKLWARTCVKMARAGRVANQDKLKTAGYDIEKEARKLDKFYKKHC